ncbi:ankyrin repeat domain-containing protein [Treponema sp.]|uniref:ankyrin repeat domain-containing protein n=1 Tax=Treponema sp. TaxID=166 RepID=UPI00298D76CE|nr:ankyrin repeat domain-containing protein [Treponema sp.]MCR5613066.1 ankyrin repeat domain-containing protein [Treponema sp.]
MKENNKILICLSLCAVFLSGCKHKLEYITTVESFADTPEYELAVAAYKKNLKKMDKLCKLHPEFINRSYSDRYYSVLHWTCQTNNYVASKKLLELGMNPDVQLGIGDTPLYSIIDSPAVFPPQDFSEIAQLLISYGADCNIRIEHDWADNEPDLYGETPFMYAATLSNKNIKKIMIENGADINAKTRSGITATVRCLYQGTIF